MFLLYSDTDERRWWSFSVWSRPHWRRAAERRDPEPGGCPGSQTLLGPGWATRSRQTFSNQTPDKRHPGEKLKKGSSLEQRCCNLSQASFDSHPASRARWKGWITPGLQQVYYWQNQAHKSDEYSHKYVKKCTFYVVPERIQSIEKCCEEQGSTESVTHTQNKFSVNNLIEIQI